MIVGGSRWFRCFRAFHVLVLTTKYNHVRSTA